MNIGNITEYTKTEMNVMAICSTAGACLSFLLGGFDAPVQALLVLICLDYFTGIWTAWKKGNLSSKRGFHGLLKKIMILAVVAFANMLDTAMLLNHLLRTMVVCGYAGMEGLSIVENVDRMGYGEYIPAFIREKLVQLRSEKESLKKEP